MDQIVHNQFLPQQLLYFVAGRRCCQKFVCSLRSEDIEVIVNYAHSLGLRSQCVLSDGQECMKVFKQSCRHYLEEPKFLALSQPSAIEMSTLLARSNFHCRDELQAAVPEFDALKIPSLHMPILAVGAPAMRHKSEKHCTFLNNISNFVCLSDLLTSIYIHRVFVFKADLMADKILLFPLIILEDSEFKKSNLKIICIERENILAKYNSDRLANILDESVGETVGIEIPQHNCLSSVTHIVYTTAKYFLRSLINKSARNLNNITHFVINDIHLHDPYIDILLTELKMALTVNQNLRIILLSQRCDSSQFVSFFGEGAGSCAMQNEPSTNLQITYIEDIQKFIAAEKINLAPQIYENRPQMFRNKSLRNNELDKCLQVYEELGTDAAFRPILYMMNFEFVPVNYQHSFTGKTAIIIAVQLNNVTHLRLLLFMGANPSIVDNQHESAISLASLRAHTECLDILNNHTLHRYVCKNLKPEFIDYDLIMDLVYLLCGKSDFPSGNILIMLPTYYHMIKLNYMLLSHLLNGNLPVFSVYLLHEDMEKENINALITAEVETFKIVLSTGIIESLQLPISFKYLIDTACERRTWYDSRICSTVDAIEWVSKDVLLRRLLIVNTEGSNDSQCFRLMPKDTYEKLEEFGLPALQTMHLDMVCLMVKLLSPNTVISEYLTYTIAPPPLINIHHTVQFLKKIDVLDDSEDVTWLGCRLVDIPLPCQLGRTLIFGILLQCLDPILTIVSSLCTADPLNIPHNHDIDRLWDTFTIYIQNRIKVERYRLAADQFSDHFIFVRLYQEWQTRLRTQIPALYLSDEYEFILNGLMEQLTCTRSKILSALRTVNLIQCQGPLSTQHVNSKSSNWPLVKAALTAGMYPNICAVDRRNGAKSLKSALSMEISLHPNSVLRDFLQPLNEVAQNICTGSQWIVCSKQRNNIKYATLVVPLAVALFAGSSKLGFGQISEKSSIGNNNDHVNFFIDEWIWMVSSKIQFELVTKMRQHFFRFYQYLLINCNDLQKWRGDSATLELYGSLIDTFAKMFAHEECAAGFKKYPQLGHKPVAKLTNFYMLNINSHFIWPQDHQLMRQNPNALQSIEKQYFLLYIQDTVSKFYQNEDASYLESVIGKFARPLDSPNRHIYVILYSKNPDVMLSISRVMIQNGSIMFKEYFRNRVPVYEILEACACMKTNVPNFEGRLLSSLIDKRIGTVIMDLFAFRHHWMHQE